MYRDERIKNLSANWGLLLNEACSDALFAHQEQDAEYAAALVRQQEALARLCRLAKQFETDALWLEFETRLSEAIGAGTNAQQACYLAGAKDAVRLVHVQGLMKP